MRKLLLLAALSIAPAAHALSGNELYTMMSDEKDVSNKLAAVMYVAGFTDALSYNMYAAQENKITLRGPMICLPKGSQVGQSYDIIKTYLERNPANRHLDAGVLASIAMRNAWACN